MDTHAVTAFLNRHTIGQAVTKFWNQRRGALNNLESALNDRNNGIVGPNNAALNGLLSIRGENSIIRALYELARLNPSDFLNPNDISNLMEAVSEMSDEDWDGMNQNEKYAWLASKISFIRDGNDIITSISLGSGSWRCIALQHGYFDCDGGESADKKLHRKLAYRGFEVEQIVWIDSTGERRTFSRGVRTPYREAPEFILIDPRFQTQARVDAWNPGGEIRMGTRLNFLKAIGADEEAAVADEEAVEYLSSGSESSGSESSGSESSEDMFSDSDTDDDNDDDMSPAPKRRRSGHNAHWHNDAAQDEFTGWP